MNKIKLTKEQYIALKYFIEGDTVEKSYKYFVKNRSFFVNSFRPLTKFTNEQFAQILCGWYEIEEGGEQ